MYKRSQRAGELGAYIDRELTKLEQSESAPRPFVMLDETYVAPTKPRAGMVVFADGTKWNPGSGRGVYVYKTSWVFLG